MFRPRNNRRLLEKTQIRRANLRRPFVRFIVAEDRSPASGPPVVKTVNIGVLEHTADPHIHPLAWRRLAQAPHKLSNETLPLLHFSHVGHGISPVVCSTEAPPRLAIHLARRSRLARADFAEAQTLDDRRSL